MHRDRIPDRYRIYTGQPRIPHFLKYRGLCGGAGGALCGLQTIVGTALHGVCVWGEKPSVLRR